MNNMDYIVSTIDIAWVLLYVLAYLQTDIKIRSGHLHNIPEYTLFVMLPINMSILRLSLVQEAVNDGLWRFVIIASKEHLLDI